MLGFVLLLGSLPMIVAAFTSLPASISVFICLLGYSLLFAGLGLLLTLGMTLAARRFLHWLIGLLGSIAGKGGDKAKKMKLKLTEAKGGSDESKNE